MSRPYVSVKYVETLDLLPKKLERGRAYFIGDEGYVIVDYGNGPVIYGGKPGPQGVPGEPQPQLQSQIDDLTNASIDTTYHLHEVFQKLLENRRNFNEQIASTNSQLEANTEELHEEIATTNTQLETNTQALHVEIDETNQELERTNTKIEMTSSDLQRIINDIRGEMLSQINDNSEALIDLIKFMHNRFSKIDNVIYIVTKLLASLYPNADIDMNPDIKEPNKLSQGEIISSGEISYKVRSSYTESDGSVVVILDVISDANQALVLTLNDGDTFADSEGHQWTVSNYELVNDQGVLLLSYAGQKRLVESLKQGDLVEYDGNKYVVSKVSLTDGQGELSLIPVS